MNILFEPWVYDSKDPIHTVWPGIVNGFLIGASEGIIIYLVMKTFGLFSTLSLYG